MEHRYTGRGRVEINVVVSCARIGLIRGTATNIGMGGMFVALDCVLLPLNAPVTVSFQPDVDDSLVCLHVPGMVVHQHEGGVGVMFDDLEPNCSSVIRGLLQAPPKSQSSEKPKQLAHA